MKITSIFLITTVLLSGCAGMQYRGDIGQPVDYYPQPIYQPVHFDAPTLITIPPANFNLRGNHQTNINIYDVR